MARVKQVLQLAGVGLLSLVLVGSSFPEKMFSPQGVSETIVVNTFEDQYDTDADHCSLREAIRTANYAVTMMGCPLGSAGSDVINLPAGTYTLTIEGLEAYSASGDLDIDHLVTQSPPQTPGVTDYDLIIYGSGMDSTIITSAWTEFDDRILDVKSGASASINNLTITGGHTQDMDTLSPSESYGAGIRNNGLLDLFRVIVEGNLTGDSTYTKTSSGFGGGVYNGLSAQLSVTQSIIRNNTTGISHQFGTRGGGGGGLFNDSLGIVTIDRSIINNNATGDGNSLSIHAGHGGGIYNAGTMSLTNTTIYGNVTGDCDCSDGTAGLGGGIYDYGTIEMESVTIAENTVGTSSSSDDNNGGGIYLDDNEASSVSLHNTLIGDNHVTDGVGEECYSLSGKVLTANYTQFGDLGYATYCPITGSNIIAQSITYLQPLVSNGGPTQTTALEFSSPAKDNGDPLGFPYCDQRGFPRPIDGFTPFEGSPDIGAYEYHAEYAMRYFFVPLILTQ